jgi:hypothetical protein
MVSAKCIVNGVSVDGNPLLNYKAGIDVASGSTITVQLQDIAGVGPWSILCTNTDELNDKHLVNATKLVNTVTKTATFVVPSTSRGSALQFTSLVNNGQDINGVAQPTFTYKFGVFVPDGYGNRLFHYGMTNESNSKFAYVADINGLIQAVGSSTGVTLAGDLGFSLSSPKVIGLQGNPLQAITLGAAQDGYVPTYENSTSLIKFKPTTANGASIPASGSLTPGNVLKVLSSNALTYDAVNLAGGSAHVTGVLPRSNQQAQSLAGDASGDTSAVVVTKVNGVSIPASPTANRILVATSGTSATYAQITDGYVAAGAAIAGSKITPNFGSQLLTCGSLTSNVVNGTNTFAGAVIYQTRIIVGSHTLDSSSINDYYIFCNFASGQTITLTAASANPAGRTIKILDVANNFATNNLTIAPNGADTIAGLNANKVYTSSGGSVKLVSNGVNGWYVV